MARRSRYRRGEKSSDIRVSIVDGKPSLVANWGGRMYGVPLSMDGAGNTLRDSNFGGKKYGVALTLDGAGNIIRDDFAKT